MPSWNKSIVAALAWMLLILPLSLTAAEPVIVPGDEGHARSSAENEPTLTPEQLEWSRDTSAAINAQLDATVPLPDGVESFSRAWHDSVTQLQIRNRERAEDAKARLEASGNTERVDLFENPLFGSVSASAQIIHNTNFMRGSGYAAPPTRHRILAASGPNHLEGANRRLKDITDKLSNVSCGNFDWVVQLKGKFNKEALTNYVTQLSESALAAAPMALLATWSPTLYEIVKWLRMFAGAELDADAQNCHVMMDAMTDVGNRMVRGAGWPECMKRQSEAGMLYPEANRFCQGGQSSPFDGLENRLGNINSLGLDRSSVNVTELAAQGYLNNTNTANSAVILEQNQALLNDAIAKAALVPDPGPEPTPSGTPAHEAWAIAKKRHSDAQTLVITAQAKVTGSEASLASHGNVWQALQYGIAKNAQDLVGGIRVSWRGDIDVPTLRKRAIQIHIEMNAFKVMTELRDYLRQHARIVVGRYSGSIAYTNAHLQTSYEAVGIYLTDTMLLPGRGVHATTFATIDRMAWMVVMRDAATSIEAALLEQTYFNELHITHCSTYEVASFLLASWNDGKESLKKQMIDVAIHSQNPDIGRLAEAIEKRFAAIDAIYQEVVTEARERVLETLPLVNAYRLPQIGAARIGGGQYRYAIDPLQSSYYTP